MKIVQFGLHYSPNVGDGIISETLGHAIRTRRPGTEFVTVDISGRSGFGAQTVRNRALALAVLGWLPRPLRGRLVEARLGRMLDRVEPDWRAALDGADLAIIGGGQIFSDADLNFCTKIARVAALAGETRSPVAVHAAGVSHNWSARGRVLFSGLFDTDLRAVGLRDGLSVENWTSQTQGRSPVPVLARDPGLLAAECYGPAPERVQDIALCITAPQILHYHSDSAVAGAGAAGLDFFVEMAGELTGRGHRVRLFCNGAAEDRAALTAVAERSDFQDLRQRGQVTVAPPPDTPGALAALIRSCGVVIAHRMHACIVAYSYRIPVVGLGWDRKLESFFASVGEDAGFIGGAGGTPAHVADVTEARMAAGIDAEAHDAARAETWAAVDRLLGLV